MLHCSWFQPRFVNLNFLTVAQEVFFSSPKRKKAGFPAAAYFFADRSMAGFGIFSANFSFPGLLSGFFNGILWNVDLENRIVKREISHAS